MQFIYILPGWEGSAADPRVLRDAIARKNGLHVPRVPGPVLYWYKYCLVSAADIVLWRNKKLSGAIFVGVTMTWYLFERIGYPLITFLCQILMLLLAVSFVRSKAASLTKLSPPNFPDVLLSEDVFSQVAQRVRHEINEAFITFCCVASGKDVLVFVKVIAGLWLLSVAGSWFGLLTFSYIVFVLAFTVPVIYETYQDPIDSNWDKFMDWNRISVVIKLLKIIRGHLKGE